MDADAVLREWIAREDAVRAQHGAHPLLDAKTVATLTGLQQFEAMLAGTLPRAPFGDTIGMLMVEVTHGRAVFQGRPSRSVYNPMGAVHGGWFATLLDSAMGCAVHAALPAGRAYTTLELKVNLVRALTDAVPRVRAIGEVVHVGRQTATAQARLVDAAGRLYAHGTTTCLLFDRPA